MNEVDKVTYSFHVKRGVEPYRGASETTKGAEAPMWKVCPEAQWVVTYQVTQPAITTNRMMAVIMV